MNAVLKKAAPNAAAPRSAASLEAEVNSLERKLADARRRENADRVSLPRLIAENDAREIAECRQRVEAAAEEIAGLVAEREETREALKIAQQRERTTADARTFGGFKQMFAGSRQNICDLHDAAVFLAAKLRTAQAGLESDEARLRTAGITPDPYWIRATLIGKLQMLLHLETDGVLGEQPTLYSPDELRGNGAASLKAAAQEYETLALQRVRTSLGVK